MVQFDNILPPPPSTVHDKDFIICNAIGGLDVTRLVSTNARNFFSSAIEDVELMREYVSEFASSGNWTGDFSNLEEMSRTLDWQARGLPEGTLTVDNGMGYADDRPDRRVERFAGLKHGPDVGTLDTEFAMVDSVSPLLPWITDRRSKESAWWKDHMNGRSEGVEKEPFLFDSLYTAAWMMGKAETLLYYPPLTVYQHPLTIAELVGEQYDSREEPYIAPANPENNPQRRAIFTEPYPDVALPGVALISAIAPVYYTGSFRGYQYNDTYVAIAGVDIKVEAVSSFLDNLQDTLAPGSFGLLVDDNFNTIVVSQEVVRRIYPERTGFEDARVTYDLEGNIVMDRRNQTYLPSDTIAQKLTKLENANWMHLLQTVQEAAPGERQYTTLNITQTGATSATEFYVMFEKWDTVSDWTLLAFAPTAEVNRAIQVYTTSTYDSLVGGADAATPAIAMEGEQGAVLEGSSMIVNGGNLDVQLSLSSLPNWVKIAEEDLFSDGVYTLHSGDFLPIQFQIATSGLAPGTQSDSIVFDVQDDDYPDCFYNAPVAIALSVVVTPKDCGTNRIADTHGNCICDSGSVAINGGCMKTGALVMAFLLPILALAAFAFYMYTRHRRRLADAVWEIDPKELEIADPPVVIGQGSFGRVVLGEYRGSSVAVKTARVSNSKRKPGVKMLDNSSGRTDDDMEKGINAEASKKRSASVSASKSTSLISGFRGSVAGSQTKAMREDFIKEIRMLCKLQHRNITVVLGAVVKGTPTPSLVLEYMERGSLYDLLHSDTTIDGQLILDVLKDVTAGLRFLHSAKPMVIHGDIKARNILIDEKLRAKVSDFGNGSAGTPFWMSPELLLRKTESTPESDVYAFGITLYEIYAKSSPYCDEKDANLVLQQVADPKVNKRPPFPPAMKSGMAAMMHDCLVTDPAERPTLHEIGSRINRFQVEEVEYKLELENTGSLGFLSKLFPAHVAQSLSEGRTVTEPESYESISIVYCEIVGFGQLSADLPPIKVADLMHRLFDRFDALADEHGVFKIDMSGGGAWMGATNVIKDQPEDHAKLIAQFTMAAVAAAKETLVDEGHPGRGYLDIQCAIVSGPAQGKVIGSRTPRYSLFGPNVDAVSFLASQKSRMGGILCTDITQHTLEQQAPEIETAIKARVFVPGLGATTTFWVNPPSAAKETSATS